MITGFIIKVSGPLIVADQMKGAKMYDVVHVGPQKLMGEIIEVKQNTVSIQVYEETTGLMVGDPVISTGEPLSIELGPGLLTTGLFDGILRPLNLIAREVEKQGFNSGYIRRGIQISSLDRNKKWAFKAILKEGDFVVAGDILGTVQETDLIQHKILVPFGIEGELSMIKDGEFTILDTIAKVGDREIKMMHKWPVRKERPKVKKHLPTVPLITQQRIIDTFFPIPKGGAAAVPGPFGAGKTVI